MLTFRKGTAAAPTAAQAMAEHLREQTLPEAAAKMARWREAVARSRGWAKP